MVGRNTEESQQLLDEALEFAKNKFESIEERFAFVEGVAHGIKRGLKMAGEVVNGGRNG